VTDDELDLDDRDALLVYADVLQQRGDPRGELIVLQDRGSADAERAHLAAHPELLADIATLGRFTSRLGFIVAAELIGCTRDEVARVLAHPSCRFLRDLSIAAGHDAMKRALVAIAHPHVRSVVIEQDVVGEDDESWEVLSGFIGDHAMLVFDADHLHAAASAMFERLPRLERVTVTGWELFSSIASPTLRELVVADGSPTCRRGTRIHLPALERLAWHYRTDNTGTRVDVDPDDDLAWLWRAELPALRHLDLSGARVTRPLLAIPPLRALAAQLATLWLPGDALGERDDAVLAQLRSHAPALRHLRELGITRPRRATPKLMARAAAILPNVRWR